MSIFQFDMFIDEIETLEKMKTGKDSKKSKQKTTTEEIIAMAKKRGITPPKD